MLYREIIAVCSQIHTKHINTLCGQNVELLCVKLVVYIVTTGTESAVVTAVQTLPYSRCGRLDSGVLELCFGWNLSHVSVQYTCSWPHVYWLPTSLKFDLAGPAGTYLLPRSVPVYVSSSALLENKQFDHTVYLCAPCDSHINNDYLPQHEPVGLCYRHGHCFL
jgi:hypothetical protein